MGPQAVRCLSIGAHDRGVFGDQDEAMTFVGAVAARPTGICCVANAIGFLRTEGPSRRVVFTAVVVPGGHGDPVVPRKQDMRRTNQRNSPAARALLPALLAPLLAGGCGGPELYARESAVERARQTAADAEASFTDQLQVAAENAQGDQDLRDRLESTMEIQTRPASLGRPLQVTIDPGRQVVAHMVFFGHGEAGGGWTKVSYNVRLCAMLSGTPGPAPTVEVEDLTCPGDLQPDTSIIGTIDETVPLSD